MKRTNDISPAIHRWDQSLIFKLESVERTTEPIVHLNFRKARFRNQSSASRTQNIFLGTDPSSELLGYYHSSALRTRQTLRIALFFRSL